MTELEQALKEVRRIAARVAEAEICNDLSTQQGRNTLSKELIDLEVAVSLANGYISRTKRSTDIPAILQISFYDVNGPQWHYQKTIPNRNCKVILNYRFLARCNKKFELAPSNNFSAVFKNDPSQVRLSGEVYLRYMDMIEIHEELKADGWKMVPVPR